MPTAIILDIDETLCHTSDNMDLYYKLKPYKVPELRSRLYVLDVDNGEGYGHLWGIKRPYIDEFLSFCFREANYVVVWSAGTKDYVESMIKILFAGHHQPHYYFHRDHCYDNKGDLIKPLEHLHEFEKKLVNVPLSNMIILDNKESNFDFNTENGLLIDDYIPSSIDEMMDNDMNLLYAQSHIYDRILKLRHLR